MIVSRSGFLRGLAASALLPASALAASEGGGAFRPDLAASGATAGGATPWTDAPRAGGGPLRFAVIGDNTGIARPGVFDQAMRQIGWLQPDFILSVGDLIEGYIDDKAKLAAQWEAVERSVAKAGVPFIYTPGNHDLDNEVTAELWREKRGAGYYAFTYKGALFLILNTEDPPTPLPEKFVGQFYSMVDLMAKDPDKADKTISDYIANSTKPSMQNSAGYDDADRVNISDKQLAFVRDTLARHVNVRWTFVILHKPAWKMASPAMARIQLMLGQRPYTVFAGHTHYFTHDTLDGRDFINMATTGGIRQRSGPGTLDHTMLVTLGPAGPSYANMRLSGLMDVAGETGQVRTY
jgi:hypothetical protein